MRARRGREWANRWEREDYGSAVVRLTSRKGARLIGTSSHGSRLYLRSICAGRVSAEWILLLAISTDAAVSLNGHDMVMGAFRENMGECGDGVGDGMALGCATLTANIGRFD